jgi:hypothetical protein
MKFVDSAGHTNYEIPVSNGLLTPDHVKKMGDAVWLELLLEDMVTDGEGDDGIVLGGNQVQDRDLAARLGKKERTVARYRKRLNGKYIVARRGSWGYTYRVLKSKKWALIRRVRPDKNVRSAPLTGHNLQITPRRDLTYPTNQSDTTCRSHKETSSRQLQKEQQLRSTSQAHRVWAVLGIDLPVGHKDFRLLVESSYDTKNGRPLAIVMGTCADAWQDAGGKVPGPFFRALARLRAQDKRPSMPSSGASTDTHLNILADIIPGDR